MILQAGPFEQRFKKLSPTDEDYVSKTKLPVYPERAGLVYGVGLFWAKRSSVGFSVLLEFDNRKRTACGDTYK